VLSNFFGINSISLEEAKCIVEEYKTNSGFSVKNENKYTEKKMRKK
jgi:hypothetical protein